MNLVLFLSLLTFFGIIYFVLGWRAGRAVKTESDYFVAGRSLGIWQISANLIATQLGGGMLLGTAAIAYRQGWYGMLYTLGMALGFLLLSCGVARALQRFQVTTTAALFETQYGSVRLKQFASLLSIITLFGILVAQVVGLRSLLSSIGIASPVIASCLWLSVVAYTMLGGLRAITINDLVQLSIITITFGGIFFYQLLYDPWSWSTLLTSQSQFSSADLSWAALTATLVMPALFSLIEQDLAQRFFASRSPRVATLSALNAGVFLLVFSCIPVYFGISAKLQGYALAATDNPLMVMISKSLPEWMAALAFCAIVAAIISTADALMNAISANITQDFALARTARINPLKLSKACTVLVGVVALVGSFLVPPSIVGIIINSYALSVCGLLVPLLVCYFKPRVKARAAAASCIAGLTTFIILLLWPIAFPKELIALAASALAYIIADAL